MDTLYIIISIVGRLDFDRTSNDGYNPARKTAGLAEHTFTRGILSPDGDWPRDFEEECLNKRDEKKKERDEREMSLSSEAERKKKEKKERKKTERGEIAKAWKRGMETRARGNDRLKEAMNRERGTRLTSDDLLAVVKN